MIKNGANIIAFIAPSGKSNVLIPLAIPSLSNNKLAPIANELGNKIFILLPTRNRAICGTISPIQPIVPLALTHSAQIKLISSILIDFINVIFTPRDIASLS